MGHTVQAAVLATVLVGVLRNARRAGVELTEQAQRANAALCDFAGRGEFVTGQVARIDLNAATATIVNAGHPQPLRIRDGRAETVSLPPDLPFGTAPDPSYREQQLSLRPGDRLVFLTDGMLDRNAAGVDIEKAVIGGGNMHPREAAQHLVSAVLHATDGELADDATVMCFDWHGGPPRKRTTASGANR